MYIKSIKLNNFRNHENKYFELSPKTNVFYGDNAQGKTNILESIYFCSLGKSFRAKKDSELVMHEKEIASLEMEFTKNEREKKVNTVITNKNKKQIKINDIKITKMSELFGNVLIVLFSPEDIEIIKGDPSARRKFFDLLISQLKPSYMYLLQQYYKILEQRNNLLKRGKFQNISLELDIWDEKLIELDIAISKVRKEVVVLVEPIFKKYVNEFSKGKEEISIKYKTQVNEEIKENIINKRTIDIERGFSSIGVHRDDYKFEINGESLENFGSQGQIKTAVLSLKLAQKEVIEEKLNEKPIMLLDDVMSELDKNRREYILTQIQDCQIIITCTDIDDIKIKNDTKTFLIKN